MTMTAVTIVHYGLQTFAHCMPGVLELAKDALAITKSDASTDLYCARLCMAALSDNGNEIIIAGLQNGKVIGYVHACIDEYYGSKFAQVLEYHVKKMVTVEREATKRGLGMLTEWARARGATKLRAWAAFTGERNARVRLFRRYGFESTGRVMIELPLAALEE